MIKTKKPVKKKLKKKAPNEGDLKARWSPEVISCGWLGVPWLLLDKQTELGLEPQKLCVLLHLMKHWWKASELPYPSHASLAASMGRSPKHVQKVTKQLESLGLIEIHHRKNATNEGQTSNEYSFQGLIEKLKDFAETEKDVRKEKKKPRPLKRKGRKSPKRSR